MVKEKTNYIKKSTLYDKICDYKESGVISDELHLMLFDMAKRVASKYRFYSYTWKEDMITDAYLRCIKYIDSYDISKKNPFGYFTTIIHHTFFAYRTKEMNYQYKKWDELSKLISNLEHEHNITFSLPEDIKLRLYNNTASPVKDLEEDDISDDIIENEESLLEEEITSPVISIDNDIEEEVVYDY